MAGAGPRPSNPLSQGLQLRAKNSTFGEWQSSWGWLSSLQEASGQNGHHQIEPSVANPEASDYSVDDFYFFFPRVHISLLFLPQNKAELPTLQPAELAVLGSLEKAPWLPFFPFALDLFVCLFVFFLIK